MGGNSANPLECPRRWIQDPDVVPWRGSTCHSTSQMLWDGAPGVSSQRDQPVLGHFNPWPLVIAVCGSDFPWPILLWDVRVVGVCSPLQAVSGCFHATTQMFV